MTTAKPKTSPPKTPSAEKRSEDRIKTVSGKLEALTAKGVPQACAFVDKALAAGVVITHNPKLHDARALKHYEGLFVTKRINDGYVHSLSVSAKPGIAGDVDFEVAGNGANAVVYAIATEIMRSQSLREFITDPVQLEVLDYVHLRTRQKVEELTQTALPDQIPAGLPTTAHYHGDETRVFTIMLSPLMLMRYGNARAMHAKNSPLSVRKALVKYGTTGSSTQNTTSLPNGSQAIAIVHPNSTPEGRLSGNDALLYSVTKRGLIAGLQSIYPNLNAEAEKLLKGFSVRIAAGASSDEAAKDRAIKNNLVRGVAQRIVGAIHQLLTHDDTSYKAIARAVAGYTQVGNKITAEDAAFLSYLSGGNEDQRRIEACAARIASKLMVLCRLEDESGTFMPTQHQFALMSEAILQVAAEVRA